MKKFICGLLVGIMLTMGVTTYAVPEIKSALFSPDIKLNVDGKPVETQIVSVIKSGEVNMTNYVSARALSESLGATVEWDGKARTINVSTEGIDTVSSVSVPARASVTEISNNVELPTVVELYGVKVIYGLEMRNALNAKGYELVNAVNREYMQIVKDGKIIVRDIPSRASPDNKVIFPYDFYEAHILPLLQ